jgi:hypothetical protein
VRAAAKVSRTIKACLHATRTVTVEAASRQDFPRGFYRVVARAASRHEKKVAGGHGRAKVTIARPFSRSRSGYMDTMSPDNVILVKAAWDPNARVWWTESADLFDLNAEGDTLEELVDKLPAIAADLAEASGVAIPANTVIEVVAHATARAAAAA